MPVPTNAPQLVKDLHTAYCARTGYDIRWNMHRENQWREWCTFGDWTWSVEDLARVIAYLRSKIARQERNQGALKFENLIGNPGRFEEDLSLAKEEALRTRKAFSGGLSSRKSSASAPVQEESAEDTTPLDPAEAARLWKEQFGRSE